MLWVYRTVEYYIHGYDDDGEIFINKKRNEMGELFYRRTPDTTTPNFTCTSNIQKMFVIVAARNFRQIRFREIDKRNPNVTHRLLRQKPFQKRFRSAIIHLMLDRTQFRFDALQILIVDNAKDLIQRHRSQIQFRFGRPFRSVVVQRSRIEFGVFVVKGWRCGVR